MVRVGPWRRLRVGDLGTVLGAGGAHRLGPAHAGGHAPHRGGARAPFLGRVRTVALGWCVATAIAGVVAYWMFFRALEAGPAGPATAVTAIYPVVTALLAVPVLRQAFTLRTVAGIVLAVAAAVLLGGAAA